MVGVFVQTTNIVSVSNFVPVLGRILGVITKATKAAHLEFPKRQRAKRLMRCVGLSLPFEHREKNKQIHRRKDLMTTASANCLSPRLHTRKKTAHHHHGLTDWLAAILISVKNSSNRCYAARKCIHRGRFRIIRPFACALRPTTKCGGRH